MAIITDNMECDLYNMGKNGMGVEDAKKYLVKNGASVDGKMMQDGLDIFCRGHSGKPLYKELWRM